MADDALDLLDQQMPSYPHDHYLQLFRGYFLKNRAISARDLGNQEDFKSFLEQADQAFQTIRAERPNCTCRMRTTASAV